MWGFASYRISSGAPARTISVRTRRPNCSLSLIRVFSLPSEKVPAPPSPNCTFDSGSRLFCCQKVSTLRDRSSTGSPRSITRGFRPARASIRPQNRPAGPRPTTTGTGCSAALCPRAGGVKKGTSAFSWTPWGLFLRFKYCASSASSTSRTITNWGSWPRRASRERRTSLQTRTLRESTFRNFAISSRPGALPTGDLY